MTTTLPLFWHLSSASKQERISASVKLVGALEQFQAKFITSSSVSEDDNRDGLKLDSIDALNAQDLSYSIRRLIRGLASPRESSRLGFAVALTELLSRINTVTCSQIVHLIIDASKSQGSMTGQEERDVLFARLFGLTAVVQAGLLVRTKPLATSASSATLPSTLSSYQEIITQLLALGEKKSWLRESASWTVCLAIDALGESDVLWKEDAVEATIQSIIFANKSWSPEKVAMVLKLQNWYPERDWRKVLLPSFRNPDLFSTGNLQIIAGILKESATEENDAKGMPKLVVGSWKPQVHFVWDIILDRLLPGSNSVHSSPGSFQEFFRVVVDESLFSPTSSPERKYWGFQVFQKTLTRVTPADMPMLFTKNFMRSWINHLSQSDRYLHKVARQVTTEVQTFVQKNPRLGFALILQLTGVNGSQQFDKLTKTKTVQSILTSMDADGIKHYIDHLLEQIDESERFEKTNIQAIDSRRTWVIEQLAALIRNGAIPKSDEWIQSILDWFVVHGLFVIKKKSNNSVFRGLHSSPNPTFSDELRQSCRKRLLSCLADLTSQITIHKSGDNKTVKMSAVASDSKFWVSRVVASIERLEKDTEHVTLLMEADIDNQSLYNTVKEVSLRLKNASGTQLEAAKGVELLLMATFLLQYCPDEQQHADTEALEACVDGATRMFPEGKKGKKSRKVVGDSADIAPEPVDVLVDVIIGFLENSTVYLRTVGNQVFSMISGFIQESTIDLILKQLERRDPSELANNSDDDMEDGENEDDGEDSGSKDDGDEVDSEGEDTGDGNADIELRKKVEDTLQGDSDRDEDDQYMDDEQMMVIDKQLAEVFRSQASEKKSSKFVDAQRDATHFKNRVLDLVDTFVKKQPTSPHVVRLILPLVKLIAGSGSDERQLSDKAKGILRARISKLKEVPPEVDMELVTTVLKDLHTRARKVHSSDILAILSHCSIYLSKVFLHSAVEAPVLHVYRQSLSDFVTRKNSALNTIFFQDFIRRYPKTAWNLRGDLLELSERAINVYRQCQIFQLLHMLISHLPSVVGDRQEEITEFMRSLRNTLFKLISNACDNKVAVTVPQMKELFKLGLLAIRRTKRVAHKSEPPHVIWEPNSWIALSTRLGVSERFKSSPTLRTMCQQLAQTSQPKSAQEDDATAAAKRKAEDDSGDEEGVVTPQNIMRKKVKQNMV